MSHKISSATATAATPPSAATATQITLQPKLPPTYCYFRGGGSKNIQLLLWLLQHNDDILQLLKIGYSKAIERLASVVKSAPETLIVTSDPKNWLAPMVPVAGWNASCTVRQDLMISVKAHESLAMVKQMLMVMLNEKIPEIPLGSPAKLYRHRSILWDQLISDAEGHTPSGSSCGKAFYASDNLVLIAGDETRTEGKYDDKNPDILAWIAPVLLVYQLGNNTVDKIRTALQKLWPGAWSTHMLAMCLLLIEIAPK